RCGHLLALHARPVLNEVDLELLVDDDLGLLHAGGLTVTAQHPLYARDQLFLFEWLDDVVLGVHLQAFDLALDGCDGAEDDDGDVEVALDAAAEFEAIHFRHHQVDDDQMRDALVQLAQCFGATPGGHDLIARVLEDPLEYLARHGIIVDDQNPVAVDDI